MKKTNNNDIIRVSGLIKLSITLFLLCLYSFKGFTQDEKININGIFSSTSVTFGKSDLLDTYLSPIDYKGIDIGIVNERIFLPCSKNQKWIAQQFIRGDFSSNNTIYGSGSTVTGFLEYSFGMLYKIPQFIPNFNIYGGSYASLGGGFIYNLRNGNNPVSAKVDLSLGLSIMATYKLELIKKHPFNIRYQLSSPLVGAFFCPNYEQSYYEIFSLGNNKGIVHPGIWGKRFDIENIITFDIPFSWIGLRLGYENRVYNNHVNSLKYRRVLNSFLIGITKDFIPNNRKKNTNNNINVINPIF